MARTPKNIEVQDVNDESIDQAAVASAMDVMRDQAQEDQLELLELASDVGAIRALELTRSLVAAATVRIFQKVRSSNKIKDLPIRQPDGSVATATNLDDFCRLAFGKNRAVMFEAAETLEALGEHAYEAASRLGLNRAALRATRALPTEKLEIVRAAIAEGSTKAEVLSVIEDLAEKVQKVESEKAELEAERQADKDVLAKKTARIEKLEREKARLARQEPEEALKRLHAEAGDVVAEIRALINGALRQAVAAFVDGDSAPTAAGLVGQVHADLLALRSEYMLPEVGSDKPEWQTWAEGQEAANGAAPAEAH